MCSPFLPFFCNTMHFISHPKIEKLTSNQPNVSVANSVDLFFRFTMKTMKHAPIKIPAPFKFHTNAICASNVNNTQICKPTAIATISPVFPAFAFKPIAAVLGALEGFSVKLGWFVGVFVLGTFVGSRVLGISVGTCVGSSFFVNFKNKHIQIQDQSFFHFEMQYKSQLFKRHSKFTFHS